MVVGPLFDMGERPSRTLDKKSSTERQAEDGVVRLQRVVETTRAELKRSKDLVERIGRQ